MSLKDIMGEAHGFADLDPHKLLDLVQALWDQREAIPQAVAFVGDHGDALVKAGSFDRHHVDASYADRGEHGADRRVGWPGWP